MSNRRAGTNAVFFNKEEFARCTQLLLAMGQRTLGQTQSALGHVFADKVFDEWKADYPQLKLSNSVRYGKILGCKKDDVYGVHVPSGLLDHVDMWQKGGKQMLLTSHVYQHVKFAPLFAWAERSGLYMQVSAMSWYYPSVTMLIEITTKEKWEELQSDRSARWEESRKRPAK